MAATDEAPRSTFRFLYRTDEGVVSRALWWRGVVPLAAALVVLTGIWFALSGFTNETMQQRTGLFDVSIFAAYAYLIFYGFSIILIAICFYNLSAKRWRALARPAALAGLVPFAALLAGAAHFLQPHVAEVMPRWSLIPIDLVLAAVVLWSLYELGIAGRDE